MLALNSTKTSVLLSIFERMREYKIGRYPEADIVLQLSYCSRDHAKLTVTDSGKILLHDSSSNGTTVNGKKIHQETIALNYGDEILFAGVEKLDWSTIEKPVVTEKPISTESSIREFTNKEASQKPDNNLVKKIVFAALGVAIISLLLFVFTKDKTEKPLEPSVIYSQYKNTVALVEVSYYIRVKTTANDLFFGMNDSNEIVPSKDKSTLHPLKSEGTAFFIDSLGMLVTNRHVIQPWKNETVSLYFYKKVRPAIKKALLDKGWGNQEPDFIGEIETVVIYPNGCHFSASEGIKCTVQKTATNEEIDLASIQTQSRHLPAGASYITTSQIETNSEKIKVNTASYIIGFPLGDALATDEEKNINCTSTQGSFTQEPAKYYIQYSAPTAGGASGSPVFNEFGRLVAINYLGSKEQSFNRGILAKYLLNIK